MELIERLRAQGLLTPVQAARLEEVESGRLFSLHRELRLLIYLGVLLLAWGIGVTVKGHLKDLGPAVILTALGAGVAACFWYCFSRALPYEDRETGAPTAAFDYILYLGCALVGVAFGYLEFQYKFLKEFWDFYLLGSSALFFALAYRFDNRLVLALAIFNLGAWFGVRFEAWRVPFLDLRLRTLLFSAALAAAGKALEGRGIKAHFTDTYLTVAANAACWALLAKVFSKGLWCPDFWILAVLCGGLVSWAYPRRRFWYFAYGVVYGYTGASAALLRYLPGGLLFSFYSLLTTGLLIWLIFGVRRHMEESRADIP